MYTLAETTTWLDLSSVKVKNNKTVKIIFMHKSRTKLRKRRIVTDSTISKFAFSRRKNGNLQ